MHFSRMRTVVSLMILLFALALAAPVHKRLRRRLESPGPEAGTARFASINPGELTVDKKGPDFPYPWQSRRVSYQEGLNPQIVYKHEATINNEKKWVKAGEIDMRYDATTGYCPYVTLNDQEMHIHGAKWWAYNDNGVVRKQGTNREFAFKGPSAVTLYNYLTGELGFRTAACQYGAVQCPVPAQGHRAVLEMLFERNYPLFAQYAKKEWNLENIEFLGAVADFKATQGDDLRKAKGQEIMNKYLKDNSPNPINISYKVRQDLACGDTYAKDCYDQVYKEIFKLVQSDTLMRFLTSPAMNAANRPATLRCDIYGV